MARSGKNLWRTVLLGLALAAGGAGAAEGELLNASYDVARDVYRDLNPAFVAQHKAQTGKTVSINQSHGGSSKQARAVIDGLEADVVTMNNPLDIDQIAKAGLLPENWSARLPNGSAPSWSAILFLVRKGNPKQIRDWGDLVRPGVAVILPNPKTSGNGRYSYLAGWEWAKRAAGGDDAAGEAYVRKLFANVPVLDTGGRGATTSFVQRGIGDVLLTFENEIALLRAELGAADYEVVVPSLTVRADNPVAVVDKVAAKHGNTALANAYLQFHYAPAGQEIFARNYLRPVDAGVLQRHAATFPKLNAFLVDEAFGSWPEAQKKHFADGGVFDRIYSAR
ncbi:sulfate ABC transporter substrate-binding protein [Pseudoxanthomonas suwonensis]|uniref:Thiosulfate transporter subunit n=1 Tax=Pseudoxanthomonas suwonensis TaxID=314722 RepID=A0A0E3Z059_9GAMM|nr:sulfate ABC transporter substrate-binding protein [Pseudoxanthomonas suwonensis]AKC85969.1 thiosulfate transporter subunit [Pseudoxanthomonas suwonensis]